MRIAVAQLGPRQQYAEASVLYSLGHLERLFTDFYAGDKPLLCRALKTLPGVSRFSDVRRLLARTAGNIPADRVTSFDALGVWALSALRRARSENERRTVYARVGKAFQAAVIRQGFGAADHVLVSTGAAADIIEQASAQGVRAILQQFDHPAPALARIEEEERTRWPGAEIGPVEPPTGRGWELGREEEARAISAADVMLVASHYTAQSLRAHGYRADHAQIVPLAIDLERWGARLQPAVEDGQELRVLYAGQVSLRKGVLYLVEALRRLASPRIRLRIAGVLQVRPELLAPPGLQVELLGPVPRSNMPGLMRWADLFVFPTLGEGFGLVQVEAMACGTPVIATTACGEVVRDGIDGHIVPPRDPEAIARWLDFYARDPHRLDAMRQAARARAEHFSLERYAERLVEALRDGPSPPREPTAGGLRA